jgi:hypothetical protein
MKCISTPPVAATLLEAMRAIGYSFEAAVADLIDNSLSAEATRVDLFFPPSGTPYVAILDNGRGMVRRELMEAMRHGSRSPLDPRSPHDLGRFGLGLKTASLSQARQMTVVSKREGVTCGAEWNLDEVARRGDWALLELEEADLRSVPRVDDLQSMPTGTLVVWRVLDRALAGESDSLRALQDHMDRTRSHVALVFHRYMEGNLPPVTITMNGMTVTPLDPFLRARKGRQSLPPEVFQVGGQDIRAEAHILPHLSKLSAAEIAEAGGAEGLRRNQGFYVYRNRRLITWGTWFRLARQEEMTKLARVIVDVPNSLDHLWSLDVKKSSATPPERVRQGLRQIVDRIAERSRRVHTFRGTPSSDDGLVRGWERLELRGGRFRYRVNRDHDLLVALRRVLDEPDGPLLERFVQVVEESFPYDAVYADMAADKQPFPDDSLDDPHDKLMDVAVRLLEALHDLPDARRTTLERLHLLEPFCRHPEVTAKIREKLT